MQYVVIGAGPAGVTAVETIRKQDPSGEVVLIGDEPEPAYSRMAIPYYLSNKIQEQGTYLRHDPKHLDSLGVRQLKQRVTRVDSAARQLQLAGGETLGFDRLLLATGSDPVKPPIDGLDQPGVHHCWTLKDARNIVKYAQPGSHVVLMGAGFIGCIIMEALAERGVDLTVVEMGDRMVPRMMDQVSGNLIKQWCLGHGVTVHTSTRVTGVKANGSGNARITLSCDPAGTLEADLVVVATGVKPAVDYLRDSGIELAQGVVVNEYLESSVPGIYAAGDTCEGIDWGSDGQHAVHAIQPVAAETGRIAALNMCGEVTPYPGSMAMNVLDTLGLVSVSYGQWMGVPGGDEVHRLDSDEYRYIKLQFNGDRLIGAITLGRTEHVGVLRGLIQSRTRLGKWKQHLMEDPTRIMEAYLGATQLTQG